MFHKFVDFYMVIINQILHTHTYPYMKIIPNSSHIFIAIVLRAMLRIQIVRLLLFRKVWAV